MKLEIKELTNDKIIIVGIEIEMRALEISLEYGELTEDDDETLVLNLDPYIMSISDTEEQLDDKVKDIKLCMKVITFLENKGFEYENEFEDANEGCASLSFVFDKEDLELINP